MWRKKGVLLPLEVSILEAAIELRLRAASRFYGFLIAKEIRDREGARLLTSHGTLYKALDRMEKAGLVASEWEDPAIAAEAGRPRRRLYRVTAVGESALKNAATEAARAGKAQRGLAPS